jgi:DNA-binding XRE family transcriptional regulator
MQAIVKMPHTEKIIINGIIPEKLMAFFRKEHAEIIIIDDEGEEIVPAKKTAFYRETRENTEPGDVMRLYRTMRGMTQEELGEKMGGINRQNISAMENGSRRISLKNSKKLSEIFDVPYKRFL